MGQLRTYPEVTNIVPSDGIWLDRIGQGTVWVPALYLPAGGGGTEEFLVTAPTGTVLQVNAFYGVKTSVGAISMTLPHLSLQTPPQYLEIMDLDNNAGTNNITVNAFSGDTIYDHGVGASSFVIQISNTITRFAVNTTGWVAVGFGS